MKVDNIDAISNLQSFNGNPFYFGNPEPSPSDRVEGFTWFEPNGIFPQPWSWRETEQCWLSSPFVFDFGYTTFTLNASGNVSWTNRSAIFYGSVENRIFLKDVFGNIFNTGGITHDSNRYMIFTLDRFIGSDQLQLTLTIEPDTQGLALPAYSTSNSLPSKPSANSMKRITMMNQNIWMPGNTWYQRLRTTRFGSSTTSALAVGISLIQVLQFARI